MSKSNIWFEIGSLAISVFDLEAKWRITQNQLRITKRKMNVIIKYLGGNMKFAHLGFAFGGYISNNQKPNAN